MTRKPYQSSFKQSGIDLPLPYINVLKSIAILGVLLFHFIPKQFKYGYLGLDLFFVITGFLIQKKLKTLQSEKFLAHFLINRFRRLVPPLAFMLFGCWIFGYLTLSPKSLFSLSRDLVMAVLFNSDIYYMKNIEYFDFDSRTIPLLHTWSLGSEFKFLLLWSSLFFMCKKIGMQSRNIAFFLLMVSLILNFQLQNNFGSYFLFPLRFYEFMFGVLAFEFYTKLKLRQRKVESFRVRTISFFLLTLITLFVFVPTLSEKVSNLLTLFFLKILFCFISALCLIFINMGDKSIISKAFTFLEIGRAHV